MELEYEVRNLKDYLKNKKVLVAFSGGADSSLIAYIASKVSKESLAVTVDNGVDAFRLYWKCSKNCRGN